MIINNFNFNPIAYKIGELATKNPGFEEATEKFLQNEDNEVDELDLVDLEDDE